MFDYEYEKRSPSSRSGDSRPVPADWARSYPSASRVQPSVERAQRPLPKLPGPIMSERLPTKITVGVGLRAWVSAGAACVALSAALVAATLLVARWSAADHPAADHPAAATAATAATAAAAEDLHAQPIYARPPHIPLDSENNPSSEDIENDISNIAILEKLSLFKNIVANRDRNKDLLNKQQIHPLHDVTHHPERKIEKKDKAKLPDSFTDVDSAPNTEAKTNIINEFNPRLPEFKPILPEFVPEIKLPENYFNNIDNKDYEEYYNDENLYEDYMQSNTMSSYLIEKVQELHDWITKDPDFEAANTTNTTKTTKTEFSQLLRALNDSLLEGNVTIVMNKLKEMYFGDDFTTGNNSRKVILTNSTDLLSFGILTLDIMLLHNIQLMAWENQEMARVKMMKDPDVFAFNALFMEPGMVEERKAEALQNGNPKRARARAESSSPGGLFESVLEAGLGAARAALHLGRAYKNARNILSQLSSREPASKQNQLARRVATLDGDGAHAHRLQTSLADSDSDMLVAADTAVGYSTLDCVWLLYCRNLAATTRLGAPYGTMARINGVALRVSAGALDAERAAGVVLGALAGGAALDCDRLLPRCSKVSAAAVVLEAILQPTNKQPKNRGR